MTAIAFGWPSAVSRVPSSGSAATATERQAERLLVRADDSVLVVEAMEVVGNADRVQRDRMRRAAFGRLSHGDAEVGETLDQLALLARKIGMSRRCVGLLTRVAQNSR